MIPKYEVQWTQTAEQDLASALQYIADQNVSAAQKLLAQFKKKASDLEIFPERCRIVPELKENGITSYRELLVEHWRVICKISSQTVYVLAVLDARRNLEDILLNRFLM